MSYGITLRSLVEQALWKRKRGSCLMFTSKREEKGNSDPGHTMSKLQKAGSEDGMFSRQSTEHSIKKEGLLGGGGDRRKDWETGCGWKN